MSIFQKMTKLLVVIVLLSVTDFASSNRSCKNGKAQEPYPETIKNTTILLQRLRRLMADNGVDGYIIPSADPHQTEYVAPWYKRRAFITGMTGSAGTAVVTMTKAALWVDGRYHDQSEFEVDCNWIIQKQGLAGVPSMVQWMGDELVNKKIGFDPKVISNSYLKYYKKYLLPPGYTFQSVDENLVDKIWDDRPVVTKDPIFIQPVKYAGQNFTSKLVNLRETMLSNKAGAIIVDALDDVAWLLNLRGNDTPFIPFFYAYIIVTKKTARLFIDKSKITNDIENHLCTKPGSLDCVTIANYSTVQKAVNSTSKKINNKFWISPKTSVYISDAIEVNRQLVKDSPIQLPKARKNYVEIAGMELANIKDGVAIMEYFVWLKEQIAAGKKVTELSGAEQLRKFKSQQKDFRGLSFSTISCFGPNAAIMHYGATNLTDTTITDKSVYLVDSGAQFPHGSTDITRTIHLGTPTDFQKEMFTRVLKGVIGLASIIFPFGTYGRNIDILARKSLWRVGLDYRHGTGHGIGSYLSIHEGPGNIGPGRGRTSASALYNGMVFSDEPGYYETGNFGIRLETAICIRPAKTKYKMAGKTFYGFKAITWVPFERKLINVEMLTIAEIVWLNKYYADIRKIMGPELEKQGKEKVRKYMLEQTKEFHRI